MALALPKRHRIGFKLYKEFVELDRGSIQTQSEAGKGSRFSFILP